MGNRTGNGKEGTMKNEEREKEAWFPNFRELNGWGELFDACELVSVIAWFCLVHVHVWEI